MDKLKPCPFCGGEAKKMFCDGTGRYTSNDMTQVWGRNMTHKYIQCVKCGVRTKVYATDKGAFNAWNRRLTMYDELVKALRCKTNDINDCTMCAYHNACYGGTLELIAADAIEKMMAEIDHKDKVIQGLLTQIERLQHEQQP